MTEHFPHSPPIPTQGRSAHYTIAPSLLQPAAHQPRTNGPRDIVFIRTDQSIDHITQAADQLPQHVFAAALIRSDTGLSLDRKAQVDINISHSNAADLDAQNDLIASLNDNLMQEPFPSSGPLWHVDILTNDNGPFAVGLSVDRDGIDPISFNHMTLCFEALLTRSNVPEDDPSLIHWAAGYLAPFETANRLPFEQSTGNGPKTVSVDLPEHYDSLRRVNPSQARLSAHIAWGLTLARLSHLPYAIFGSYDTAISDNQPAPYCLSAKAGMTIEDLSTQAQSQLSFYAQAPQLDLKTVRHAIGLPDDQSLFKTTLSTTTPLAPANAPDEDCAIYIAATSIQAQFAPRFTADAARRIMLYFAKCLEAIIKLPSQTPLQHVTMIHRPERERILSIGACETQLRTELDMVQILEQQAQRTPEAPALSQMGSPNSPLSYLELSQASNRVAHSLMARGITHGDVVAICLERSPEFVIAMFAILKAGAIYVPVDPAYPSANKEHMQTDSGAKFVITQTGLETAPQVPPLLITDLMNEDHPSSCPEAPKDPDRVAYMIYTSGTTGKPKGVVTTHRGTISHALAILSPYDFAPSHTVLQCSSMSFDVSVSEILGAYLSGAHLVLRNDRLLQDVEYCIEQLAKHYIAIAMLPMAFWCVLTEEMYRSGARLPSTLKSVIVGGERATPNILQKWREVTKGIRWINAYGPTETAVYATIYIEDDTWSPDQEVPIGRPLEQCNVHILCYDGSLAPLGVKGFLWISGVCVAKAYHNRPDLSAEKFHEDAARLDPHLAPNRYYNTGDVALWNSNDNLDFFGRIDRQVQVRGFRVELPAIERSLEAHSGVERAMIAVLDEGTTSARLLAFVQLKDPNQPIAAESLRDVASQFMPRNIAPTIHFLTEFPKTPNGKVDFAALIAQAQHAQAGTDTGAENTAAQDDTTSMLCTLFAQCLGLEQFSPNMSFFAQGGHSLLALRLSAAIDQQFGRRLSVAELINHPTPRAVREVLGQSQSQTPLITQITPHGAGIPIYGIHVLGALGEFYRSVADHLNHAHAVFGVTILGSIEESSALSVAQTCEIYADQIDAHAPKGQPVALGGVSLGGVYAITVADLLRKKGRSVAQVFLFDSDGPMGRPYAPKSTRLARHARYFASQPIAYTRHYLSHRAYDYVETRWVRERLIPWLDPQMGHIYKDLIRHKALIEDNQAKTDQHQVPVYDGPVTYVQADLFAMEDEAAVAALFGWRALCPQIVSHSVPTTHLGLFYPPHDQHTARIIRDTLSTT